MDLVSTKKQQEGKRWGGDLAWLFKGCRVAFWSAGSGEGREGRGGFKGSLGPDIPSPRVWRDAIPGHSCTRTQQRGPGTEPRTTAGALRGAGLGLPLAVRPRGAPQGGSNVWAKKDPFRTSVSASSPSSLRPHQARPAENSRLRRF